MYACAECTTCADQNLRRHLSPACVDITSKSVESTWFGGRHSFSDGDRWQVMIDGGELHSWSFGNGSGARGARNARTARPSSTTCTKTCILLVP